MTRRILVRLAAAVVTLACIYTLTFLLVITIPGNPFHSAQRNMPEEVVRALETRYNMDSDWSYYVQFITSALRGDLGPSFVYKDWTCNQILASSLPVSLVIGLLAMLLAVLGGVTVGVYSALHRNSLFDLTSLGLVLIGISLPTFVTGTFLLITLAVWARIAPAGGWGGLSHLWLPALTLSLPYMAYIARLTRVGMLDTLSGDYIRTARAKGLAPRVVIWKHAFKNAFLPVLSYLGPATAMALTGSFVVEKVFNLPGLGQHFVNSVLNLDRGLIMSTVLVFSSILIFFNLVVDVLYSVIDPRIRGSI